LKNLTDALRKALDKYAKRLRQWSVDDQGMRLIQAIDTPALTSSQSEAQKNRHTVRQERFQQTHHLHQMGWQQIAIARQLGICPRTVRRYLASDTLQQEQRQRKSKLDAYKVYLLQRWNEGCHNARQLTDEIRSQGYSGG
jgi:hypothetical protein